MTAAPPAPVRSDDSSELPPASDSASGSHIGLIVAGSLAVGLLVGVALVAAPFVPAKEGNVTGALLCGFAVGWAMLALLSLRFGDRPQRWAFAPSMFMGVGGLLLMIFGTPAQDVLRWVWPPALLALVIWMVARSRRRLRGSGRWLLYPVFFILLLASVGGVYETVSEALGANAYPMSGQLIDVGGHSLHLSCNGDGSPTVILQPGGGEMSAALGWIAPAVSAGTRVCVYDRAGRGWSEPADSPQDATQIATDLHKLLDGGQVPGPYVLAGHSFGGLYVLTYAAMYPEDVVGMVLVDSTAPASSSVRDVSPGREETSDLMSRVSALISSSARVGVGRLIGSLDYGDLPPQSRDEARASSATASYVQSTVDEYAQASASSIEAASLVDFGDKPLIVLTAGLGSSATWMQSQDHLATLSSNSLHSVVEGANHGALIHNEQSAATTTQAVLDVVAAVRSGQPLGG